jgi:hypothetical protein
MGLLNPALLSRLNTPKPHQRALSDAWRGHVRDAGDWERPRDFHLAASGSKLIAYELSQPPVLQEYT